MSAEQHRKPAGWIWCTSATIMFCVLEWAQRLPHPHFPDEPQHWDQLIFPLLLAVSIAVGIAFTYRQYWAHIAMRVLSSVCLVPYGCGSLILAAGRIKEMRDLTQADLNLLRAMFTLNLLLALYVVIVAWSIPLTTQKT